MEWKKLGKSLKRIKIIFKGELTSWVYASSGVLHRGCTSAVEAHMAGIKTGYIVTNKEWIRKSLPYQVSEHLYNSNQIIEFCKSNISKKPLPPKEYIEAFKNTIRVEKIFACEIIAEDMIKFDLTSELPFNCNTIYNISDTLKVIFIKIKSFIIKLIKKLKDGVLLPDKIPGGITKKEITNIMDNFEIDHKLKIRQILIDCVEIEE